MSPSVMRREFAISDGWVPLAGLWHTTPFFSCPPLRPPQMEAFKRPSFSEILEELEDTAERLEFPTEQQPPG